MILADNDYTGLKREPARQEAGDVLELTHIVLVDHLRRLRDHLIRVEGDVAVLARLIEPRTTWQANRILVLNRFLVSTQHLLQIHVTQALVKGRIFVSTLINLAWKLWALGGRPERRKKVLLRLRWGAGSGRIARSLVARSGAWTRRRACATSVLWGRSGLHGGCKRVGIV